MTSHEPGQLVEFRSYRIVPGGVGAFVEHFEEHFLASQEQFGMDIVGQFRVVDDAERFVWVRRYLDPSVRAGALTSFYTGPVWKEFGPRANELMVEHTDVHLLVPDPTGPPFAADHQAHADRSRSPWSDSPASSVVAAFLDVGRRDSLSATVADAMTDAVAGRAGVVELGRLVSASATNDFPPLPVHEDTVIALWLLSDSGSGAAASAAAADVARRCALPLRTLSLLPTRHSTLR